MYLLHFCNEDMELFLCFDEASVNSSSDTATTSQQRMGMELDGSLARDLLCLLWNSMYSYIDVNSEFSFPFNT